MIRINLLPVREARRKADLQQFGLMIGVALGAAVAGVVLFHMSIRHEISNAQDRVVQMKQEIDAFKPQLAQVEQYRAKKADIERKLGVIHDLDRSRSGPVHVLDELSSHAPERLWLTSLEAIPSGVTLQGMSLDNEVVATFMKALEDSPYFQDVELRSTELSERDGLKLNKFEVHAMLKNPEVTPVQQTGNAGSPATEAPVRTAAAATR
ncbi:MAG TPA: PilN domain-containing protein [Myxococcota bacterium]|nr:PilN domain-containing protein [Myxococcota bacterium]